jgi:hypothetical protein
VQWFHAEAEIQHWQEQWEQNLEELLGTWQSFSKMQSVWKELTSLQPLDLPGTAAYAHQKAAMYVRRKVEAEKKIKTANFVALFKVRGRWQRNS